MLLPGLALAGRPLNTEDASTLDDTACQVESWVNRSRGDLSDFSFVPACALFGVEWQAGGVRTREAGSSATTAMFVQGKHAFRSVDDGDWGVGVVAGLTRFPRREAENGRGLSFHTKQVDGPIHDVHDRTPNIGIQRRRRAALLVYAGIVPAPR